MNCSCCGGNDYIHSGIMSPPPDPDHLCGMCAQRARLCLHNIDKHPGRFHSSRPGPHNYGDPETCPVCIEARESVEWLGKMRWQYGQSKGFGID